MFNSAECISNEGLIFSRDLQIWRASLIKTLVRRPKVRMKENWRAKEQESSKVQEPFEECHSPKAFESLRMQENAREMRTWIILQDALDKSIEFNLDSFWVALLWQSCLNFCLAFVLNLKNSISPAANCFCKFDIPSMLERFVILTGWCHCKIENETANRTWSSEILRD